MEKKAITVKTELILSKDEQYRYALGKVWDKKKALVTVVTLYPGVADGITEDLTTMLMTNQIAALGYGGFFSVNLFSKLGLVAKRKDDLVEACDPTTDEVLSVCAEQSEKIIFAWGSLPNLNQTAKKRRQEVIEKLTDYQEKCVYLTDGVTSHCLHPLAPAVRYQWHFEKFPYEKTNEKHDKK